MRRTTSACEITTNGACPPIRPPLIQRSEKDLQRQVTVARTQLRDLRTSNDTSQAKLFDHSERQDQETIARLAEADIITEDLERANSRVAEVERRNEKLRAEIVAVRSGSESAAKYACPHDVATSDAAAGSTRSNFRSRISRLKLRACSDRSSCSKRTRRSPPRCPRSASRSSHGRRRDASARWRSSRRRCASTRTTTRSSASSIS